MTATPYEDLLTRVREAHLLGATQGVLSWDQQTMVPRKGVPFRAQQMKLLAGLSHEKRTDPVVGELLAACEETPELVADPASDSGANLRELRRRYDRATRLPGRLVAEIAEAESLAQDVWAEARATDDFAKFEPYLTRMVALMREKAACLRVGDQEDWEALADDFEPGVRVADLVELFAALRARLTPFVQTLMADGTRPDDRLLRHEVPRDRQFAWVRAVSAAMGFDYERGRLDEAAHPFCSGSHPDDVRITTRFHDAFVLDALGSTMHEAGHGIYEQGLPAAHAGTPLGSAVSLGIHESQSRLWENHVGRSHGFWRWGREVAIEHLGPEFARYDLAEFYGAANLVTPDLIRVEADEATYNLHVIVRFEIELAMIRGDLLVADLPAAWGEAYRDVLGVTVPDDARGCLQDVHWSCGLFGYFPTYTLGNLYAAQLFEAAAAALGSLDDAFAAGDFSELKRWLNVHVHAAGSRYPAPGLCERVTGKPLDMAPLMRHLEDKLRPIYQL